MTTFHLPVRPYTPIDAHNRRAAATGSPRYASLTSHADYNGHAVSVRWNEYRGYYIAEYWWAGRVVLARGELRTCVLAAVREYERGALGASVSVSAREDDAEAERICDELGLRSGPVPHCPDWYTWRHTAAAEGARDAANPGMLTLIFDWPLLEAAADRESYEAALRDKHGRVYG